MIRTLTVTAALALMPTALAVEVLELRVGSWEMIGYPPDQPTPVQSIQCLTPEELENMRFFIANIEDCTTLPGGKQTKTTYEIEQSCGAGDGQYLVQYLLESKDSVTFTASITFVMDGTPYTARATGRWLHEGCDITEMPIS